MPLVFPRVILTFSAGPTTYEINLITSGEDRFSGIDGVRQSSGQTTIGVTPMTRSQLLLVLALSEPGPYEIVPHDGTRCTIAQRLTASVQREQATAAESGGAPTTAPPAQGTEAEPAPPVTTTAVATTGTASVETATPATTTPNSPTEIDALVRKLYEPIVRKLKAEMRLDRERAGYGLDLAH